MKIPKAGESAAGAVSVAWLVGYLFAGLYGAYVTAAVCGTVAYALSEPRR